MELLFLSFVAAIATRLAYQRWLVWLGWGIISLIIFLVIWLTDTLSPGQVLAVVVGASALGFVSPELWEALRAFLRRPRNAVILIGGSAGTGLLIVKPRVFEDLVKGLAVLGIIIFGFWIMFRPLLRGGRR